jgi:hypothetical protein
LEEGKPVEVVKVKGAGSEYNLKVTFMQSVHTSQETQRAPRFGEETNSPVMNRTAIQRPSRP